MRLAVLSLLFFLLPAVLPAETVRLDVTDDAMISSERGHYNENWGQSVSVPVRQNQNWQGFETKAYIARFDMAPLEGRSPRKAWLNIFLARGELYGIGLCSVLSRWQEGDGINGQTGKGGANWNWAHSPAAGEEPGVENYWAWPGSGAYSVIWAHPDLIYSHAGPSELIKKRLDDGTLHVRVPVDPELVAAMAAGLSDGFVLTDDKGQVAEGLSLKGMGTPYRYNYAEDIYMFTREIQDPGLKPFLEVETAAGDAKAPSSVGDIGLESVDPYSRIATLMFSAPGDDGAGGGKVLGYEGRLSATDSGWDAAAPLPLWEMPRPVAAGETQKLQLASLKPGTWYVYLRAVDEAGNRGEPGMVKVILPDMPVAALAVPDADEGPIGTEEVTFGNTLRLWACSDLTKVDPVGGGVLTDGINYRPAGGERFGNEVWSSREKKISLTSARGEVIAFQLILERMGDSKLNNVSVSVSDLEGKRSRISAVPNIETFRLWYMDVEPRPVELTGPWELVEQKDHKAAWHADACLPLAAPFSPTFDLPSGDNLGEFQRNQSVWVDVFVPNKARAGTYRGTVSVSADGFDQPALLAIELKVLPIELPKQVSWLVELNGYSYGIQRLFGKELGKAPDRLMKIERRTYQMAHKHRSTLNLLPYGQAGTVPDGSAPTLKGEGADTKVDSWKKWDNRYGDLLSGRAFTPKAGYHGPGEGMPLEHIYLAFHENWPLPIKPHYADFADINNRDGFTEWTKNSRSLEEAFSKDYKQGITSVSRQFFEHFKRKGYTGTNFQFYFNNKYYFKSSYFKMNNEGHGSSFWLLDEPVDYDDYAANRFYLSLVREGWLQSDTMAVKAHFRTDVSQPEMARGLWDGLCNVWNSSGLRDYATTVSYRMAKIPGEAYWHYGGGPPVAGKMAEFQNSFFTHWALGTAGDLPYWDSLRGEGWFQPSDLAVFYPGTDYARSGRDFDGPVAGLRLKGIRRAQQDVEYLMLLTAKAGWSRSRVRRALAPWADNPGAVTLTFNNLSATRIRELRGAVAAELMK
jgi:hypothetical protein